MILLYQCPVPPENPPRRYLRPCWLSPDYSASLSPEAWRCPIVRAHNALIEDV